MTTFRAKKHMRVVRVGGMVLTQPKQARNDLLFLDINPIHPFRSPKHYGAGNPLRGTNGREGMVHIQCFTTAEKNRQFQMWNEQNPLGFPVTETNPGYQTSTSTATSTASEFRFSKTAKTASPSVAVPISGPILERVPHPDGAPAMVFKGTLNKELLQAAPNGGVAGDDKARCLFGTTQKRSQGASETTHGRGCIDKWGRETWIAFGIRLQDEIRYTNTTDDFVIFQFHVTGPGSFNPASENDIGQNPTIALTFSGGGLATPENAKLRVDVRRQWDSPDARVLGQLRPSSQVQVGDVATRLLDFVKNRDESGQFGAEQEPDSGTRYQLNGQTVTKPGNYTTLAGEALGWPADWVYIVIRVVPSYLDNPRTELPDEYAAEWVSPRPATGVVQIWAKYGASQPLQKIVDYRGRWGNNDRMTPNINTGIYYYGNPPEWSSGGANLDQERIFYHTGLLGLYADDWPGMTADKMLSLIPGNRGFTSMAAAAPLVTMAAPDSIPTTGPGAVFTFSGTNLTAPVTVTPSATGVTFTPTSVTLSPGDAVKTCTAVAASAGSKTISVSAPGATAPASVAVPAVVPPSLPTPNLTARRTFLTWLLGSDGVTFGTDDGSPDFEYYVNAATGNDTNNGTSAGTAFATLARAITVMGANRHAVVYLEAGQTYGGTTMLELRGGLSAAQWCKYKRRGTGANPKIRLTGGTTNDAVRIAQPYIEMDGIDGDGTGITSGSNSVDGIGIRGNIRACPNVIIKNCRWSGFRGRGVYMERAGDGADTVESWLLDNVDSRDNGNHGYWTQSGYAIECQASGNGTRVGAHGFSCYTRENTMAAGGWANPSGTIWTRSVSATVWSLHTLSGASQTWRRLRKAATASTSPAPGQYATVSGVLYINTAGTGITPNSTQWFFTYRKGNPRWLFCDSFSNRMYGPISGDTFAEEGDAYQHDDATHGALMVGCRAWGNDGHAYRANIAEASTVLGLIGWDNKSSGMMIQSSIDCVVDGLTLYGNNVSGGTRIDGVAITTPTNAEGDSAVLLVTDVNGCVVRNAYIDANGRRSCIEANGTCNITGLSVENTELKGLRAGSTTPIYRVSGAPHTLPGSNQARTGLLIDSNGRPTNKVTGGGSNARKRDADGYAFSDPPNIGAYTAVVDRA